jgi:lipopolysaccharide/colanic/teichoic acid biosynthesis glycosyltransferase
MPPSDLAAAVASAPSQVLGRSNPVHLAPSERARRAVNVAVAAVGLLLVTPVMALIALAIRLTSPGPIFYRQTRIGLDRRHGLGGNYRRRVDLGGKPFTILKFRTMRTDRGGAPEVWASADDPRVTPLGRVLRKYRLDELPQLLNVLRGEMNVVGPRPEQPTIFASLRAQVPGYSLRQRVRPGITGWAQINHHYDVTVEDVRRKVGLDLEYLGRSSVTEDLRIMLQTVPAVVLRQGGW